MREYVIALATVLQVSDQDMFTMFSLPLPTGTTLVEYQMQQRWNVWKDQMIVGSRCFLVDPIIPIILLLPI